jgi:hypothetical protein
MGSRMNKKFLALGRMKSGERNKLELSYEKHLELRKQSGEIQWYKFEGMKFRLADNCFYNPDFAVLLANGEMEMHECKSIWMDGAKEKVRMAAELYPFRFIAVYALPKKDGGGFRYEEF